MWRQPLTEKVLFGGWGKGAGPWKGGGARVAKLHSHACDSGGENVIAVEP